MVARSLPIAPVVVGVYVRHSRGCKYKHDESYKRCGCPKHVRWTYEGKQHKRAAKTRSWAQAEEVKRAIEDQFRAGATAAPVIVPDRRTISKAIELFLISKRNEDVSEPVLKKYERELERLNAFMEKHDKFFPGEITSEDLTKFQAGWAKLYPSSQTRSRVLTRYRAFLRFCVRQDWITKLPHFDKVRLSEVPTLPLSSEQYTEVLKVIPETFAAEKAARVRALVQLMRHSGLSIRDAVVLERNELKHDKVRKLYRVTTSRQKTGTDVNVPLPPDVSKELIAVINSNPKYFFWNGTSKAQSAVTNWQHDLRAVFRAAGMADGHPHQLRDTFAVGLLEKGVPMEEVSKALAHESIKTTEKHYAAWIKGRQDRLDTLIQGSWD
jgi:integrase/recombinase XerD